MKQNYRAFQTNQKPWRDDMVWQLEAWTPEPGHSVFKFFHLQAV